MIASPWDVDIFSHIDQVDPDAWQAFLSPDDLQVSHGFIKACHATCVDGTEMRHVLIRDAQGPACIATFSRFDVKLELLSGPAVRRPLGRLRRYFPQLLRVPVLFCGLPVSFGSSCLRMRPGIDAAQLIPTLLDTAEAFAETLGTPLVCFKEFRPEERHLVELLPQHGFIEAPSLPGCRLPIRWNRFEQYLGDMRASYRRQVLASLRVREESGLRFRWLDDFEAECPRLFALYGEVMDRAEFQLERLNLEFFSALNRHMGAGSKALIGEWRGKVVATGVLLRGERSLTFLLAGIDYERARDCDAYINLVTEIVAEAIRTGADSLELGQTAYGLKQRLGGIPTSRSLYLRHRRALPQALYRLAAPRLFPERTPPARHVFRDATLPHRHDAMDIESSALQRRTAS